MVPYYHVTEVPAPALRSPGFWSAGKEARKEELQRIIADAQRELGLIERSDRGLA